VVLAIIAILAAILTPLVTQYVEEARVVRAQEEARIIATGINLHLRDTGKYPIYATYASPATDANTLFGPGTTPTFGAPWGTVTSISLQTRLNTNHFGLPTTVGQGKVNYRGPYSSGIEADPWDRSYIAFVGPATNPMALFVISAGPDGTISTAKEQNSGSFTIAGDDIAVRVR
jgi:type II secretory pathway pseudopilin PulG